jgi:O-antigen/teichoic acid export membrane protein
VNIGKQQTLLAGLTPLANEVISFCRNVILCLLLPIEEVGQLVILLVSLRLVELATDLSLRVHMQQAFDGGSFKFQRVIHTAMHLRAVLLAFALIALAYPLSTAFGGSPSVETFAMMALVPIIKGFEHTDYRRLERSFRFFSSAAVQIGSALIALASAPAWIEFIADHRVAVPIILTHATSSVLLSHLLATRKYRLGLDAKILTRIWRFAVPLFACALLSFTQLQGDRMVIAFSYSWEEVARYAIAAQFMMVPIMIFTRSTQSLLLPVLQKVLGGHPEQFPDAARYLLFAFLALGLFFVVGYGVLANFFLWLFYGENYILETSVLISIAVLGGVRISRIPQVYLALSLGRPDLHLKATIVQSLGILMGVGVAASGHDLHLMLFAVVLGESVSYIVAHKYLLTLIPGLWRIRPENNLPALLNIFLPDSRLSRSRV